MVAHFLSQVMGKFSISVLSDLIFNCGQTLGVKISIYIVFVYQGGDCVGVECEGHTTLYLEFSSHYSPFPAYSSAVVWLKGTQTSNIERFLTKLRGKLNLERMTSDAIL